MNKKGQVQVLILAGIVLVLALAGGIFYMGRVTAPKPESQPQNVITSSPQPSPLSTEAPAKVENPTANWKTYINTKYRYELKFPSDKLVYLVCPDPVTKEGIHMDIEFAKREPYHSSDQLDPNQFNCNRDYFFPIAIQTLSDAPQKPKTTKGSIVSKEEFLLGGFPAERYTETTTNDCVGYCLDSERVYLSKNNMTYVFYLWNKELKNEFNQILSTFRFTD